MDATTLDRMVTDLLLVETSEGLDRVASELMRLHGSWERAGVAGDSIDWLAGLVTELGWWSGRLLGGVSFAESAQGLPDETSRRDVS
ncbi:MAG: hypothetical protein ACRD03_15150 [Acidimicrobiales bacterium]